MKTKSLLYVLVIAFFLSPSIAGAADQVVTNTNDSGAGSLRQAIADVFDGDTITFASDLNINLSSDEIVIGKDITIDGGNNAITVSAATNYRVFFIMGANTVTIKNLTIRDGDANPGGGGGIYNQGELTLENCVFINNQADSSGGAIYNSGDLDGANATLIDCILTNNSADYGGGIENYADAGEASMTLINCTLSQNSADYGGGIENYAGGGQANMTLINCTLSQNSASTMIGSGGGIENYAGSANATLSLTNCTLSGNSGYDSGGISNDAGGALRQG